MTKQWKYNIGEHVRINEKGRKGIPHYVGEFAHVMDLLDTGIYDYRISIKGKDSFKVKEEELDKGFEIGQIVRVKHSIRLGTVLYVDYKNETVDIKYSEDEIWNFGFNLVELVELVDDESEEELEEIKQSNLIEGVGVDAPIVFNEKGGGQSKVNYRFDLLDPLAMFEMTKVLQIGADKYGVDNWHDIDVNDHLNHLLIHVYAYLAGDEQDDHLSHALCRSMFALGVAIKDKEQINANR